MPAQRLLGRRVRFVTGTDEHGEKIAAAAEKRGMNPQVCLAGRAAGIRLLHAQKPLGKT